MMLPTNGPMRAIAAKLFAVSKDIEEAARRDYRKAPTSPAYWAMIDLKSSAVFRVDANDEQAFARARAFSDLVARLAAWHESFMIFKELGDGVLIRCSDFRELLEAIVLLDAATHYWRVESDRDRNYPSLDSRTAITFGECVELNGDYFGRPIDLVARLSAYSSSDHAYLAVVDDEVRIRNEARVQTEYPFIRFSDPIPVPAKLLKPNEKPGRVSEITIDRHAFGEFRDYFSSARKACEGGHV